MEKWSNFLTLEKEKKYFKSLIEFLRLEYKTNTIYPESKNIFKSFDYSFKNIKVVILGQDPYHGEGQANGLAFAVNCRPIPPSLKNIFKEIKLSYKLDSEFEINPDLISWSKQGVFLLNSSLTVEKGKPMSHANIGWEIFTSNVLKYLTKNIPHPIVIMLWGKFAQSLKESIINDNSRHLIIETSHPSPFSVNYSFLGSNQFKKANFFLEKNNLSKINWYN